MPKRNDAVTVEHLTNSLAQIEEWIKAIRAALAGLEPDTELKVASKTRETWSRATGGPILIAKNCPPPD